MLSFTATVCRFDPATAVAAASNSVDTEPHVAMLIMENECVQDLGNRHAEAVFGNRSARLTADHYHILSPPLACLQNLDYIHTLPSANQAQHAIAEAESTAIHGLPSCPANATAVAYESAASVVLEALGVVQAGIRGMREALSRMPVGCHPLIFYQRVRPFLSGWRANPTLPDGVLYEVRQLEQFSIF